jgi:preprotein translocase subunit YajC
VTSTSDIDKNGESQLSKLAVGDAVRFSTTTSGTTVTIDKLHAGNEALDRPTGAGDHGHGLDLSGTVTAVGTSSVTIKTASGTSTYAVTSTSDIDKDGESQLSKLAAGDAVRFSTTTSGTTVTIDKLHAGNEALNGPQGGPEAG